jgi:hypothetical protein
MSDEVKHDQEKEVMTMTKTEITPTIDRINEVLYDNDMCATVRHKVDMVFAKSLVDDTTITDTEVDTFTIRITQCDLSFAGHIKNTLDYLLSAEFGYSEWYDKGFYFDNSNSIGSLCHDWQTIFYPDSKMAIRINVYTFL